MDTKIKWCYCSVLIAMLKENACSSPTFLLRDPYALIPIMKSGWLLGRLHVPSASSLESGSHRRSSIKICKFSATRQVESVSLSFGWSQSTNQGLRTVSFKQRDDLSLRVQLRFCLDEDFWWFLNEFSGVMLTIPSAPGGDLLDERMGQVRTYFATYMLWGAKDVTPIKRVWLGIPPQEDMVRPCLCPSSEKL